MPKGLLLFSAEGIEQEGHDGAGDHASEHIQQELLHRHLLQGGRLEAVSTIALKATQVEKLASSENFLCVYSVYSVYSAKRLAVAIPGVVLARHVYLVQSGTP